MDAQKLKLKPTLNVFSLKDEFKGFNDFDTIDGKRNLNALKSALKNEAVKDVKIAKLQSDAVVELNTLVTKHIRNTTKQA